MSDSSDSNSRPVRTRGFELAVAVALQIIAVLVIVDSLRVGIDWADDGPRAGYFPFYIGLLLLGSASWVVFDCLRGWSKDAPFAQSDELMRVIAMLVPITFYVLGVGLIGIYVASAVLIAYFMVRYGKYRIAPVLGVSLGVPLILFLVFERWFLVPLPKGPLEAMLGF
ncbi:MAG: tripartite tricarboxylate transporter TctB family protein [Burkholderiales bacterium]|jgi:putative tricarboxylic transport membrane protein